MKHVKRRQDYHHFSWRKLYCNVRISSQDLEIVKGRYCRPKQPQKTEFVRFARRKVIENHILLYHAQHIQILRNCFSRKSKPKIQVFRLEYTNRFRYRFSSRNYTLVRVQCSLCWLHTKRDLGRNINGKS